MLDITFCVWLWPQLNWCYSYIRYVILFQVIFSRIAKSEFSVFELKEAIVRRYSVKMFKISQNSQENTCAGVSFFSFLIKWQTLALLKKRLQCWCFPVKFAKFLKITFFREHLRRVHLEFPSLNFFIFYHFSLTILERFIFIRRWIWN